VGSASDLNAPKGSIPIKRLKNTELDVSVTCCSDLQNKKGNILQASVDYIKRLKKEQLKMGKLVARQEELEEMNRQLAVDVQVKRSVAVSTTGLQRNDSTLVAVSVLTR